MPRSSPSFGKAFRINDGRRIVRGRIVFVAENRAIISSSSGYELISASIVAADVIVVGVPMYNFGVPVQLKNWIDAIARNGVTFRYTEKGAEGLLGGKKVYFGLARGGRYRDSEADSQVPYLKTVCGFLGMNEVHFIYAEGMNMGPEATQQGFAQAEADLAAALA